MSNTTRGGVWAAPEIDPAEQLAYSLDEIVQLTGMTAEAIRNRCKENAFPHCEIGRRLLFPCHAVRAFLQLPEPEPVEVLPETVNAARLAVMLGVGIKVITVLAQQHDLPMIRDGGRRMFPVEACRRWLNE